MPNGVLNVHIQRPPPELVDQFRELPTTIVSDAMNRTGAMCSAIKPVRTNCALAGPAVTISAMVGCNLVSHLAIYRAQPGDVIVFDGRRHTDTSIWGYLQTRACILRGIAGVVIDGSIRDSREIRESGFAVFCRGATPAGPHKGWGDSLNVPVQCGGVPVNPGDIVLGDDDGVVVVPQQDAETVLAEAQERYREEERWFEALEAGESTVEILNLEQKAKEVGIEFK